MMSADGVEPCDCIVLEILLIGGLLRWCVVHAEWG
jgi:hypothetical protein